MKKFLTVICATALSAVLGTAQEVPVSNVWTPLQTLEQGGEMGYHIDLWRNGRLHLIADDGFLINGFEHRPGSHQWQGEHLGKWLHAATLACAETHDPELKAQIDDYVHRLIATQLEDGYTGTYAEEDRYPAVIKSCKGWDIWTVRYNLYGLLTYDHFFPDEKVVTACCKMTDQLIKVYSEDGHDITKYGTWLGLASSSVLESIVMLYDRTQDKKYLDFAEHIVDCCENNPDICLVKDMLDHGSLVWHGKGKAYELMSNILGYVQLYKASGNQQYLQTVLNAWEDIYNNHLLVTGGPWSKQMSYNRSRECFAFYDAFSPRYIVVEGCCDATWIELNIHLYELTGEAKYIAEAEKTLVNSVYGHQCTDGNSWCYYTTPNAISQLYTTKFHCCGSSEPRGLEMYSHNLVGIVGDHLVVNSFGTCSVELPREFGSGSLQVSGNFPVGQTASITLNLKKSKEFTLEFYLPVNTVLSDVTVNGKEVSCTPNARGLYEIDRKWKKGDVVTVNMEYQLVYTLQPGQDYKTWIAFNYGPLALASKISAFPFEEPFAGKNLAKKKQLKASDLLENISEGDDLKFRIKGTDVILIPYYKTTEDCKHGPYTYFEL